MLIHTILIKDLTVNEKKPLKLDCREAYWGAITQ